MHFASFTPLLLPINEVKESPFEVQLIFSYLQTHAVSIILERFFFLWNASSTMSLQGVEPSPTPFSVSVSSLSGCNDDCTVIANYTHFSVSQTEFKQQGQITFDPSSSTPKPFIAFDGYSIITQFKSDSVCITETGSEVVLGDGFTVPDPTASFDSAKQLQIAELSFIHFIGFSNCSGGGANVVPLSLEFVTPEQPFTSVSLKSSIRSSSISTARTASLNSTSSTFLEPSVTSSQSQIQPTGPAPVFLSSSSIKLHTNAKVAIGVLIPVFVILILSVGVFLLRKYRRSRQIPGPRAELREDQARQEMETTVRRLEPESKALRHELEAQNRHELET